MNDARSHSNLPPLTASQVRDLAAALRDVFGGTLSRKQFNDKLVMFLEDVPGYESGGGIVIADRVGVGRVWRGRRMMQPLFHIGEVVATRGVFAHLEHHRIAAFSYLRRHACGDWGMVPPEDAAANLLAVKHGARILSSYEIAGKRVWIITEADRSMSTLLFPDEY